MADDFNIITEEDKSHLSYGLCVLGQMAAGATLGSIAGGQTLAGAAAGTVWGLFTCRYLAEPIKRKLSARTSASRIRSSSRRSQRHGASFLLPRKLSCWI